MPGLTVIIRSGEHVKITTGDPSAGKSPATIYEGSVDQALAAYAVEYDRRTTAEDQLAKFQQQTAAKAAGKPAE